VAGDGDLDGKENVSGGREFELNWKRTASRMAAMRKRVGAARRAAMIFSRYVLD